MLTKCLLSAKCFHSRYLAPVVLGRSQEGCGGHRVFSKVRSYVWDVGLSPGVPGT